MGAAPAARRKAVGAVAALCLVAVYVSHTSGVERWLHHRERWWSSSLGSLGKVDAQRVAFSEAFYDALAERHGSPGDDGGATAAAMGQQPSEMLSQLRDEVAREQKSLDEYFLGEQGLPTSSEHAVEDAAMASEQAASTEAQRLSEEQSACAAEQHRTGVDLIGGDTGSGARAAVSSAGSAEQCCQRCWSNRLRSGNIGCKAWTFDGGAGTCYLKTEPRGEEPAAPAVVSGYIPVSSRQTCPSPAERDYARSKFSAAIAQRSATSSQRDAATGGGIAWPHTDLVLVTAWGRPEFLLATLEHLLRAEGVEEHKFVFLLDDEYDLRMLCIIDAFPRHRGKVIVRTARHDWMWTKSWGNTYNTLEGYRYAEMMALGSHALKRGESAGSSHSQAELNCKLVYLVEEDIFVAADFFAFHRAVQGGHAAGLGPQVDSVHWGKVHSVMAHNLDVVGSPFLLDECYKALGADAAAETQDGHTALAGRLLYSLNHFASLGISFDYRNLSLITQHAVPAYYNDLTGYIKEKFPNAARKPGQAPEQDGQQSDEPLRDSKRIHSPILSLSSLSLSLRRKHVSGAYGKLVRVFTKTSSGPHVVVVMKPSAAEFGRRLSCRLVGSPCISCIVHRIYRANRSRVQGPGP
jgi:hypothetical protein